jgi:hypothetical protein
MDANVRHLMTQLEQNPLDFAVLDELRQHCESTGSFAVWAEALEHHARAANEAEVDPVELGRLHFELGNLYRDQLGLSERALKHYRTAVDFDAAQRPAIAAARDIFAEAGAWTDVADLLAQEAESLPRGRKRAAAFAELAELQRDRLDSRDEAVSSLREAVASAPDDLQLTHQLATMLLDDADGAQYMQVAGSMRREAAHLLSNMARAVSDDYALAYIEVALDAVPDHAEALELLEQVAPRMSRGDVLAPRWLAAIRAGDDASLARALRVKMARAYLAVGQLDDARICLEPLLEVGDMEALALTRDSTAGHPAEPEELLSSELQLDGEDGEPAPAPSLVNELAALQALDKPKEARDPLADLALLDRSDRKSPETTQELRDILDADEPPAAAAKPEAPSSAPNARKSRNPRGKSSAPKRKSRAPSTRAGDGAPRRGARESQPLDADSARAPLSAREPEGGRAENEQAGALAPESGGVSLQLDDIPTPTPEEPRAGEQPASEPVEALTASAPVAAPEPEPSEAASSSATEGPVREAAPSVQPRPASVPPPLPQRTASEPPAQAARVSSTPPPLPSRAASEPTALQNREQDPVGGGESPASRHAAPRADVQVPGMDEEADPFAEQTQPRAAPLTLAELNSLTGDGDLIFVPKGDEEGEIEIESEVTHVSPSEDPQVTELRGLRSELTKRLRFRDRRGAAEVAEALLSRGVFDAEAINAMEEHYRLSRDFKKLRDLCELLAAELSFGKEARAGRLREAVLLSESKLGDQEGTLRNLRALLNLEPDDVEAFAKLRSTLRRGQQWGDLAELLEARAAQPAPAMQRAELYRELGALQREKRGDHERALAAYAAASELDPGNLDDAVVLSGLYAGAGRYAEAAPMYELRVTQAGPAEQTALLSTLATLYEDRLQDDERAQHALERWRALAPTKPEPLQALVRVLERRGEHRALVDALTAQLELVPASQRGPIHAHIAQVAFDKLGDAAWAADSYGEAILQAPQNASLWQQAAPAYEEAGRGQELDELLWGIANSSRDRTAAPLLFDHLAQTRAARGDLPGAILAREAQYALGGDSAALSALVVLLRSAERPDDLSRRLDELARKSSVEEARSLRFERANLLSEQLRDPEGAKAELERILSELVADDATALRKLVELCIATGDVKRRASAQERLVKLAPSLSARVELAVELIDIYEQELEDLPGAVRVLNAWTSLEPENPTPYMRLLPLLAQTGKKRDMMVALDKLAELAISDDESAEFSVRAARVGMEIEDWDGAWNRLVPLVVEQNDATAERLLRELTRLSRRGEQLSALYVGLAQRAETVEVEQKRWADAARTFEQELGAPDRALEAMLRALAKQLDSREMLAEVERLSGKAGAWPRLGQVYDAIVRKADRTDTRIELLMRHARLLEREALDQPTAFERVWLAFQLDPANDTTYGEAKRLAIATGRREELLGSYERRTQSGASREARLEALLDACALAQHELDDTPRAAGYLSRAVALAGDSEELLAQVEKRCRTLDASQPPVNGRGLVAELAAVYARLEPEYPRAPALVSTWLAHAAKIHEKDLGDPGAAFLSLERASALVPSDESLLDELSRVAALSKNWEALAKHLQHAADVAIDSNSSSAALQRLGALCERELASPSRAADAYEQLVRLRPKDAEASRRLRQCLKTAERHDELLIAIDRELFVLKPEEKRELLKQAAETWEFGLKNRYEAVDAWKKVAAIAPADPDAVAALARLRIRPRADDSLLGDAVVVLPEDLRPSQVTAQSGVAPSSSLFGATSAVTVASSSALGFFADGGSDQAAARELVEPERVTHEDLSMLSEEFGALAAEPRPDEMLFNADLAAQAQSRAATGRDVDADVTMPLEREPPDVTLPSSLVHPSAALDLERDLPPAEQLETLAPLAAGAADEAFAHQEEDEADELASGEHATDDDELLAFGEHVAEDDEELLASAEHELDDEVLEAAGVAYQELDDHEELLDEELLEEELLEDEDDIKTQRPPAGSLANLSSLVESDRQGVSSVPPPRPANRSVPPPPPPPRDPEDD